jgi:predicted peptidase
MRSNGFFSWFTCATSLVPALFASLCMDAQRVQATFESHLFVAGGDTLRYRLLVPAIEAGERVPIILFLHGAGERGRDNESQLKWGGAFFLDHCSAGPYKAIVLAPQCPPDALWGNVSYKHTPKGIANLKWGKGLTRPMQLVLELAEYIGQNYPVDPSRRYLSGLSMGAMGAYDAMASRPTYWAAAFTICGMANPAHTAALASTPLRIYHGADDDVIPVSHSRDLAALLTQLGADAGYLEFPATGHDSWHGAFGDPLLLPWLFSYSR